MQINKIIEQLERLPHEIYKQSQKVLEAREKWEMSKIDYDVSYSTAVSLAEGSATDKKAQATVGSSEVEREMKRNEMEYLKQEALLEAKNNQFIAVRKLASIEEKMLGSQISGN